MKHYSEDDLVLYFYGEARKPSAIQQHLDACLSCASLYADISSTLTSIAPPDVPERDEHYGLAVWQRVRPLLPVGEPEPVTRGWWRIWQQPWMPIATAAATAAVLLAAFSAGRFSIDRQQLPAGIQASVPSDVTDRTRVVAIGDHLERSERLLLDIVNADREIDVTAQQEWAADLIDSNRFYRQAASTAGETLVVEVLDDLERSLLDVAHAPAQLAADDLDRFRKRVESSDLLFKVRVMSDALRDRERTASQPKDSI